MVLTDFLSLLADFGAVAQETTDATAVTELGFEVQRLLSLGGDVVNFLVGVIDESHNFIDHDAEHYESN